VKRGRRIVMCARMRRKEIIEWRKKTMKPRKRGRVR
jgi:hypothetical protein